MGMDSEIREVLLSNRQIMDAVGKLGAKISEDYKDRDLMIVSVLKGSVPFVSDLIRNITIPLVMDFMAVSSYGAGTKSSGVVRILKDLDMPIAGKDVLIVEDILDSGKTLAYLKSIFEDRKPNSIRIATLLDKPERRTTDVKPDYVCFTIPDAFVVGYGLDYAEKYRNLPYVGILDPKVYS